MQLIKVLRITGNFQASVLGQVGAKSKIEHPWNRLWTRLYAMQYHFEAFLDWLNYSIFREGWKKWYISLEYALTRLANIPEPPTSVDCFLRLGLNKIHSCWCRGERNSDKETRLIAWPVRASLLNILTYTQNFPAIHLKPIQSVLCSSEPSAAPVIFQIYLQDDYSSCLDTDANPAVGRNA